MTSASRASAAGRRAASRRSARAQRCGIVDDRPSSMGLSRKVQHEDRHKLDNQDGPEQQTTLVFLDETGLTQRTARGRDRARESAVRTGSGIHDNLSQRLCNLCCFPAQSRRSKNGMRQTSALPHAVLRLHWARQLAVVKTPTLPREGLPCLVWGDHALGVHGHEHSATLDGRPVELRLLPAIAGSAQGAGDST
jgi:hypothetical protein